MNSPGKLSDDAGEAACILVVDDERRNRDLLEVILKSEGYRVSTAASGEDALDRLSRTCPDLVLLDVMMPGIDGYTVAVKIKSDPSTKAVPVILLTALDDSNSRAHGIRVGAEVVLTKPIDRAELCRSIAAVLQRR
ncbi:MAG: response regulator [Gemmatimonadaceae bacterium]